MVNNKYYDDRLKRLICIPITSFRTITMYTYLYSKYIPLFKIKYISHNLLPDIMNIKHHFIMYSTVPDFMSTILIIQIYIPLT